MKYSIDFTNRFKKSLRKGVKRGLDPTLIEKAVEKLANEGKLPLSYKSHKLHGNLEGIWECHITPDWLMLWEQNDEIAMKKSIFGKSFGIQKEIPYLCEQEPKIQQKGCKTHGADIGSKYCKQD